MELLEKTNKEFIHNVLETMDRFCSSSSTEDDLDSYGNGEKKELEIEIEFLEKQTQVSFFQQNEKSNFEFARVNGFLPKDDIQRIIDYILVDYNSLKEFFVNKDHSMRLVFGMNVKKDFLGGINQGTIRMSLQFHNHEDLEKEYTVALIKYLHSKLENDELKEQTFRQTKQEYLEALSKTELLEIMNLMSEEELREILKEKDFPLFSESISQEGKQYQKKIEE